MHARINSNTVQAELASSSITGHQDTTMEGQRVRHPALISPSRKLIHGGNLKICEVDCRANMSGLQRLAIKVGGRRKSDVDIVDVDDRPQQVDSL